MNRNVFEGRWKQIRGVGKVWWGKLTDDLDQVTGKLDVFAGPLQEQYGYSRQQTEKEIEKRVKEYETTLSNKTVPASQG
jgi:uncharacterized protein YjbJ (UPF0337 family)